MSRRTQAPKRAILPDPKYGSELLAKFMNMIMNDGKKSVAERIVYGALDRITEKAAHEDSRSLEMLETAIRKCPEQYYWLHRRFKRRPEPLPDAYADLDALK